MIGSNNNSSDRLIAHNRPYTVTVTLMGLPTPVRVYILNYFGDKQEELRTLTLISEQMNEDCKRPDIEWKIIPVFVLSPIKNEEDGGSTSDFFHNLHQHQQDDDTNDKLQRYRHMRVNKINRFDNNDYYYTNIRMDRIESLDISLLSPIESGHTMGNSLPVTLTHILPNLREIDFSNTSFSNNVLGSFIQRCPYLKKITWNGNFKNSYIYADGRNMRYANNNVKEIIMNDSYFFTFGRTGMFDLYKHHDTFIFHYCSKVLERVSIRNARYFTRFQSTMHQAPILFPQDALIKFIRNAPSTLIWFCSDLTQENMKMLQKERPGIEFC